MTIVSALKSTIGRVILKQKTKRGRSGAARNMLIWSLNGQRVAKPVRGWWINRQSWIPGMGKKKCTACKIGLVMIGRYGLAGATDSNGDENRPLLRRTLRYGPKTACPVDGCRSVSAGGQAGSSILESHYESRAQLGVIVEHLLEEHKWAVVRIDNWLAELAGTTVAAAKKEVAKLPEPY